MLAFAWRARANGSLFATPSQRQGVDAHCGGAAGAGACHHALGVHLRAGGRGRDELFPLGDVVGPMAYACGAYHANRELLW